MALIRPSGSPGFWNPLRTPADGVEFDPNPFGIVPSFAFMPFRGAPLVYYSRGTSTGALAGGATIGVRGAGRGIVGSGGAWGSNSASNTYSPDLTSGTLVAYLASGHSSTDSVNHGIAWFGQNNVTTGPTLEIQKDASNNIVGGWVASSTDTRVTASASGLYASGDIFTVGVTYSPAGTATYLKGKPVGSSGTAPTTASTAGIHLYAGGTNGGFSPWMNSVREGLYYVLAFDRAFTAAEMAALDAAPFSPFRPAARRTFGIVSAGSAKAIAGAIAPTSLQAATLARSRALAAAVAPVSSQAATLGRTRPIAAAAASSSAVAASLARSRPIAAGVTASTSQTAALGRARPIAAAIAATSDAAAALIRTRPIAGAVASSSAVTASLARSRGLAAAVASLADTAAAFARSRGLAAGIAATAAPDATLARTRALAAAIAAATSITVTLAGRHIAVAGAVAAASLIDVTLIRVRPTAVPASRVLAAPGASRALAGAAGSRRLAAPPIPRTLEPMT